MSTRQQVKHVPSGTGPTYWGPGDQITFLITGEESGGAFFMADVLVSPGGGPPPHIHHREDESFYVQQGAVEVYVNDKAVKATAGDFVHIPRGTVHSFRNTGHAAAKMLVTVTPAGLEKFFEETFDRTGERWMVSPQPNPAMMARIMAVAPNYGLEMLPPA